MPFFKNNDNNDQRVHVTFSQAMTLVIPYVWNRILTQIRAIAVIVIYLLAFQIFILDIPIMHASLIAFGLGMVVIGLALFMEGLFLGLMPLGEALGIRLPQKVHLSIILVFAFILGVGATYAEPAIGILRVAGDSVKPWEAPLLFYILNQKAEWLVYAVGTGVGIAVLLGMLRTLYQWSLKPLIYVLLSTTLLLTIWAFFTDNLQLLTGLAWDSGAVTTGPVTVPLVLALGVGVSRVSSVKDSGPGGLGVVTLASLLPIIAVLSLGLLLSPTVPDPMTEIEFFAEENKERVAMLFSSEEDYQNFGLAETAVAPTPILQDIHETLLASGMMAIRAILPLTLFLLVFYFIALRERLPRFDEILLGIFLSLSGMAIFGAGIEFGLSKLGNQVGGMLPASYKSIELTDNTRIIENFNMDHVQSGFTEAGQREQFFFLKRSGRQGNYEQIPFNPEHYNAESGQYHYIPVKGPIVGQERGIPGKLLVIAFAFLLGYGATLAEPALNALGITVEDLTAGTFRKTFLIQAVATGVGVGLSTGITRLLLDIPLAYLLLPPYLLLLVLTFFSSELFVNIGWDSAGVTTGPITVPLVLAMGLGIGNQVQAIEGFGILAMASVFPIVSVLSIGLYIERKHNRMRDLQDTTR